MPTPVLSEDSPLALPSPTDETLVDLHVPAPVALPPVATGGISASMLAGQLAPSSIAMYERDFRDYLRFAGSIEVAADAVTLARWRAWLAQESSKSPNTINRMISAVKRLMKEDCRQGYLPGETAAAFEQI